MRSVRLRVLVMTLLAINAVGCGVGDESSVAPAQTRDTHPLLEDVDPPPVNLPVEAEPIPSDETKATLPEGDSSALMIFMDEEPFRGQLEVEGSIEVRSQRIEVASAAGRVEILYRLPPEIEVDVPSVREGSVRIRELSAPAGADQLLRLEDDRRVLVLGESWTTSTRPIEVEMTQGLDIAQETTESTAPGYTELRTIVSSDGVETTAPVGKPFRIRVGNEGFEIFVEGSHFFSPAEDDADQFPATYILHVWVVRVD